MRDTPDAILMFAAGFGTRMGTLTQSRPKPLIEVAGTALIDHALKEVRDHGVARIVVNLHYKAQMIKDHLAASDIVFSDEQPDILETGGGLRAALPLLGDGPVFTMNTDAVWSGPNPLNVLHDAWDPAKMDALLLCLPRQGALGHTGAGDFIVSETGAARRGPGLIYSGLQIMQPLHLDAIDDAAFSLNVVWDQMIETGRLHAVTYPGQWCDVGRAENLPLAETLMATRHV